MIKEAKDLLEGIIKETAPGVTVAKSLEEEKQGFMARKLPLAALITNPGSFDESEARTARCFEGKQYRERYVRGHRNLPIVIRCWAAGEEKADAVASSIIPEIPSQWEYDGFASHIRITSEEHSDHMGVMNKSYLSAIEVVFTAVAARKPKEIPVIEKTELEGGEYAKQ